VEKNIMDIEAYLDGSMSALEKAAFEKKLLVDPVLRKELEQYQSLKTDLDWHFAAKDVAAAEVLRAQVKAKRLRWSRLLLATLLVLLAGFLVYWFLSQESSLPQPPATEPINLQQNTAPKLEAPNQSIPTPSTQKIQTPNQPIAGHLRPRTGDLMRNLPAETVSASAYSFFKQQWAGFIPAVPEVGIWAKPLQQIRKNRVNDAYLLLKKAPASDTSAYLLAVSELMLKRPSTAQDFLYPLLAEQKWQTEAQYLLVWAYLLEGNADLARASLKVLPERFRDKAAIMAFLDK